jgi:hypothetical protein
MTRITETSIETFAVEFLALHNSFIAEIDEWGGEGRLLKKTIYTCC